MFLKTPNTVVGPDDEVAIPRGSTKTDWEVELGVVIGTRASLPRLAGATRSTTSPASSSANDLSERDFQLEESGGQWSKGKCAPGSTRSGRGWSRPTRSTTQTCGCAAGSTASRDRTPRPPT